MRQIFAIAPTTVLLFFFIQLNMAHASKFNLNDKRNLIHKIPHLDLEMTGYEYKVLLEQDKSPIQKLKFNLENILKNTGLDKTTSSDPEDVVLDEYLLMGQKNLQWVTLVNEFRSSEKKISFSSQATQQGFPISSPRVMNFKIVQETWAVLRTLLPSPLKKVIFEGAQISKDIPVSDREFIEWLFQVDRAYQLAARYKMMKPYKQEMSEIAAYDVRGYLMLKEDGSLDQRLQNWANLNDKMQQKYSHALKQICRNSGESTENCNNEFQSYKNTQQLLAFKNKYFTFGQENYESFFSIPVARTDGVWDSKSGEILTFPFANPHNEAVLNYLRSNIEDEWRWDNWQLKLDFIETDSPLTTHVVFVPGSTPHVDGIAGSEITMDANAPLSEYDVQWTIRHEYGHVLGFPDCYIEFYDEDVDAIISYQLDITNLMCSRRGRLSSAHSEEIKRVYSPQF